MHKLITALLYTALLGVANLGTAQDVDLRDLRGDALRALMVHESPMAAVDAPFTSETGDQISLADYRGQIVVLNFWATWCAPCRKEMPYLAALADEFGPAGLAVVTVATGPNNARPAMERFFAEIGVDNLPLHTDAQQRFAGAMGVRGLPATIILDRQGRELARLQGDADWYSPAARAIMSALLGAPSNGG
jgi:thiol-disulfide isomerase/thioredoxin